MTLKGEADVEATDEQTGEKKRGRGGIKVTNTSWISKELKANEEELRFAKRLMEKLGMEAGARSLAEVIQKIAASNKELAAALEKMQDESKKLDGTPLISHMVFESWGEAPDAEKAESQSQDLPKSVGGLFKGLGKKFGKKKSKKDGKNVLLESRTEISDFSTDPLPDEVFQFPANFKKEEVRLPQKEE